MMFRDQVGIVAGWFRGWSECEQTVALLALLKRVTRTQARFLQLCLEHSLADCPDIHLLEAEANSAAAISQWPQEPAEAAVALLLAHLPLLQPGNAAAKAEYMKRLQKVLADAIESNRCVEESRQLLSYALIHPATTADDRSALALWLGHLEERLAPAAPPPQRRPPAHEWPPEPPEPGGGSGSSSTAGGGAWAEQQHAPGTAAAPRENGHPPFQPPGALPCQLHPSPLKRSLALVPGSPQPGPGGDWAGSGGPEDPPAAPRGPPPAPFGDHAPLSPQSSVASSGSEHTEEPGGRNSFQEDGSGMKDVPSWLKSLRLHKYAALFAQMSYEEMMTLTEHHLESQNVTKGARHKIALSIQKLRERQSVLRALEKDILEGGNLWSALQELQQILVTPIKAFRPPPAAPPPPGPPDGAPPDTFAPPPAPPGPDAEAPAAPVPDGDIPGQFTRVMGKVCTQLLVSRPDEENITSYLQLLEKCLSHEAFTETQKKRLQSWKQQVLKLLRAFPKKGPLDGPPGYRPPKRYLGESPCCWTPPVLLALPCGTVTPTENPQNPVSIPILQFFPGESLGAAWDPPATCSPNPSFGGGLTPARVFCTIPTLGGLRASPNPLKFGVIWGTFPSRCLFHLPTTIWGEGSKGSPSSLPNLGGLQGGLSPSLPNFPFSPVWEGLTHSGRLWGA